MSEKEKERKIDRDKKEGDRLCAQLCVCVCVGKEVKRKNKKKRESERV